MRIGELAVLAGVTTRPVRHYHRIGLLPEPARRVNGPRAAVAALGVGAAPGARVT